jgi:hypothetical protein
VTFDVWHHLIAPRRYTAMHIHAIPGLPEQ